MSDVFRRAHARISCDRPVQIFMGAAAGRRIGIGRILDISLAGAYLRFEGELKRGTPYRFAADGADGPIDIPFRVVREGANDPKAPGARHYGLVFNLTGGQERELRRLVDALRRQPPTDNESRFDRSLRDYWSR